MRILVLDGNQNQAVASVRSLAKAGHQVLVGESSSWSKAGWSRYSSGSFRYPPPQASASDFVARISEVAAYQAGTLVLPMTEATTLPLSAQRDSLLATGARLVLPSHEDVLRAFNKEETVRLAASLGIAVPTTILVENADEAREAAHAIKFPVVLKPRSSVETQSSGALQTTGRPRYAKTPEDLQILYREMSRTCSRILVQEFVDGEGAGYFALMHHGELRAEFAHRRIRDVYPTGSGSALRVSVEPDPQVRSASLAMLQALHWHGVAMVEFRQVPAQPPVFMEVNGRFWNSLPLACYAGADFPALLARMAESDDMEKQNSFRTGVACRWLLGDFRHLAEVWRGAPAGYPRPYPGRLRTLLAVMTPVPGTFHDNFQWADPLPELGDWLSFFERAFQKARS
ncbi:MAG TPA: ATP-grasp domain-containing protein [Candidatus Sulfotelmatobacter sp.]